MLPRPSLFSKTLPPGALLALCSVAAANPVTFIGAGADPTSYCDPANWSTGVVPGQNDDIVIPAGFEVVMTACSGSFLVGASIDATGVVIDSRVRASGDLRLHDATLVGNTTWLESQTASVHLSGLIDVQTGSLQLRANNGLIVNTGHLSADPGELRPLAPGFRNEGLIEAERFVAFPIVSITNAGVIRSRDLSLSGRVTTEPGSEISVTGTESGQRIGNYVSRGGLLSLVGDFEFEIQQQLTIESAGFDLSMGGGAELVVAGYSDDRPDTSQPVRFTGTGSVELNLNGGVIESAVFDVAPAPGSADAFGITVNTGSGFVIGAGVTALHPVRMTGANVAVASPWNGPALLEIDGSIAPNTALENNAALALRSSTVQDVDIVNNAGATLEAVNTNFDRGTVVNHGDMSIWSLNGSAREYFVDQTTNTGTMRVEEMNTFDAAFTNEATGQLELVDASNPRLVNHGAALLEGSFSVSGDIHNVGTLTQRGRFGASTFNAQVPANVNDGTWIIESVGTESFNPFGWALVNNGEVRFRLDETTDVIETWEYDPRIDPSPIANSETGRVVVERGVLRALAYTGEWTVLKTASVERNTSFGSLGQAVGDTTLSIEAGTPLGPILTANFDSLVRLFGNGDEVVYEDEPVDLQMINGADFEIENVGTVHLERARFVAFRPSQSRLTIGAGVDVVVQNRLSFGNCVGCSGSFVYATDDVLEVFHTLPGLEDPGESPGVIFTPELVGQARLMPGGEGTIGAANFVITSDDPVDFNTLRPQVDVRGTEPGVTLDVITVDGAVAAKEPVFTFNIAEDAGLAPGDRLVLIEAGSFEQGAGAGGVVVNDDSGSGLSFAIRYEGTECVAYAVDGPCAGDVTLDGRVDLTDLMTVLEFFGGPFPGDDDDAVDLDTLLATLAAFGTDCVADAGR